MMREDYSFLKFDYWETSIFDRVEFYKDVEENDWERTKFVSGSSTTPDETKRAKLRAKRKSRKKNV